MTRQYAETQLQNAKAEAAQYFELSETGRSHKARMEAHRKYEFWSNKIAYFEGFLNSAEAA